MSTGKIVVAITGGSGAIYAQRFLIHAAQFYSEIYLSLSRQAAQVAEEELGVQIDLQNFSTFDWLGKDYPQIQLLDNTSFYSPPASGSFRHDGMVILPCSMGTAGRIAHGISDSLIARAADVCLKERRKLILVPREMPWNLIHLKNMTQLTEAGACIVPASPAWYHRPANFEELADTVVARILQLLGKDHQLFRQWMVEEEVSFS